MKNIIFIIILVLLSFNSADAQESLNDITESLQNIQIDVQSYKTILPITIRIETTDTNEIKILSLNKDSTITESAKNPDIILKTTAENLKDVENIEDNDDIKNIIQKSEIIPLTFKGNFLVSYAEKELNIKIIQKRNFSQKVSNIFSSLVFKIKNLFS